LLLLRKKRLKEIENYVLFASSS